jgi:hypothetical protein
MTSAASGALQTRPARGGDFALLDRLFANETANPEKGFTYPACENAHELLDELRAYGLTLEQGMTIIEHAGEPIGCYGFLYEPKHLGESTVGNAAFLIGPLLGGTMHPYMPAILNIAESEAARRGLRVLRSCIAPTNAGLAGALTQHGWALEARSLEMKLECGRDNRLGEPPDDIQVLQSGGPRIAEAASLLTDAFGGDERGAQRLQGYLDDGYHVAYVERDSQLVGVAIWYGVAPFARIENIAVRRDWRTRTRRDAAQGGCRIPAVFGPRDHLSGARSRQHRRARALPPARFRRDRSFGGLQP